MVHSVCMFCGEDRYFFFQAEDGIRYYKVTGVQTCVLLKEEDGIRDYKVTGVQTCALPISFEKNLHQQILPRPAAACRDQLTGQVLLERFGRSSLGGFHHQAS